MNFIRIPADRRIQYELQTAENAASTFLALPPASAAEPDQIAAARAALQRLIVAAAAAEATLAELDIDAQLAAA